MVEVAAKRVEHLTVEERAAVRELIADAYELSVPPETLMALYCSTVPNIFLGREAGKIVAFQFYQAFQVGVVEVFQFSLAGKASHYGKKGVQKAFGTHLILRSMSRRLNPFRRFAVVGVSNNPKTYRNMLLIGGTVFPDVARPSGPFGHRGLYEEVARRLNIEGLDISTGVIRERCGSLGLKLKRSAFDDRDDPLHRGFMDYIGGDVNHGILTMVVSTPLASARAFLARQLSPRG